MKVLHVLYSKIYTGAEKVAAQIIKAFEGRVDMAYCSLECEEVWEILDGMGIRHYGVEELTPATLSRVIREYRPDVIHAHDMRTSFVAALCCGKIPLISHIHKQRLRRQRTVREVHRLSAGGLPGEAYFLGLQQLLRGVCVPQAVRQKEQRAVQHHRRQADFCHAGQ
ncbi:MAG: glycosyltransferase [Oscillospiraceae bacterium]|nr:glycosyltransferase [Oscillospiraceae bacterium]